MRYLKILLLVCVLAVFHDVADAQVYLERMLTGVVLDENGEPMPGVVVASADGKRGVMTDEKGTFSMSVRKADKTLVVSSLGYLTQTVNVEGKDDVKVLLLPDPQNTLNEVVVIGFGEVKKADLTGSVANVKMQDVNNAVGLNVGQALQGRIAGVEIMSTSGAPDEGTSIRIRGTRSIEASNEPLIIVDGVMDVVNDLSLLNPDDIESISLLKDASATAIYGSRGANGVIMVKTKVGSTSKPRINVNAQYGVSQIAKKLDVMNAQEYSRYYNDIKNGSSTSKVLYCDPSQFGVGTDWQDAITRLGHYQNYNISMSGKEGKLDYYASLGYTDNMGIIKGSREQRVSGRVNLAYKFNKYFSLAYKGNYGFRHSNPNKVNIGGTNRSNGVIYLSPHIGLYDDTNPFYENGVRIDTPMTLIEKRVALVDKHDIVNTLEFNITPIKNLVIKSTNTYKVYQRHDYYHWPNSLTSRYDEQGARAQVNESDNIRVLSDNTISYKKNIRGGHYIDVLAGYSLSYVWANSMNVNANGIVSDDLKWYNLNAIASKQNYSVTSGFTETTKQSFLARFNYNYAGKYYLTMTGRYDGSSNFAANKKWGFFPSAALKWNATKERFVRKAKWIDELAFRLSFGMTGNDAIAAYSSLESYNTNTATYIFDNTQPLAVYISRLANPNLTWETTALYNFGFDFAVLKNRLKFTVDTYYSKTRDLLLNVQTAHATGYKKRLENIGQTSNTGVELTIDSRNISRKNFWWNTTFTISHNSQMVEDMGNESYVAVLSSSGNNSYMMYGYKKGYPLNALWGFQYAGPWHNQKEIDRNKHTKTYASVLTQTPGNPKFVDQNKDGIISQDDLIYLGSSDPDLYGGLQNTFGFKNWTLSLYFTYSIGGKIYNFSEMYMTGTSYVNQYRYMLDAWHPVRNPDSWYPRAGYDDCASPSTLLLHDASYLRLQNVTLSRRFEFRNKKFFKDITVSLKGDNLFLLTEYNGYDPDVSTESSGSVLRRVDMGAYPKSRKVTVGVKLNF